MHVVSVGTYRGGNTAAWSSGGIIGVLGRQENRVAHLGVTARGGLASTCDQVT